MIGASVVASEGDIHTIEITVGLSTVGRIQVVVKFCDYCGKQFTALSVEQRFCKPTHRKNYHRKTQ